MICPHCRKEVAENVPECGHCGVIVAKFQAKASRASQGGAVDAPDPAATAAQAKRGEWFYRTALALYAFMTFPALIELARGRHWPLGLSVLAGHALFAWHLQRPSLLTWAFLAAPALALWFLLLFAFTKMGDGPFSAMAFIVGAPLFALLTAMMFGLMIYRPGRHAKAPPAQ